MFGWYKKLKKNKNKTENITEQAINIIRYNQMESQELRSQCKDAYNTYLLIKQIQQELRDIDGLR